MIGISQSSSVALERDAQGPGRGLRELRQLSLRGLHLAHHRARERHQPVPRFGQLHRLAVALHYRRTVVRLERTQLVRQRRLREVHAVGGARDGAGLGERDQGAQVAYFQHRQTMSLFHASRKNFHWIHIPGRAMMLPGQNAD